MSEFHQKYLKEGRQKLIKDLGLANIMSAPKLIKVVINCGMGEALANKKSIDSMSQQLMQITGQRPISTKARQDISSFKVRKGDVIGLKVTLRGTKMYDFIEKLVKIVLPRIRDFRGIRNNCFDKDGNYTLGLSEQIVFPEIEYSQVDKVRGLEITLVISGGQKETKKLMEYLGFPFQKESA
ncbi:50S ribosomal protein L5 [Candidatus Gottesmanbacteria bacterium RBG_16_37_8]|uniref:Large ribosomal subunit protein uL5 n=1 Tax=Candidatus Gottesmanbacteria bacterium RBG_16_37_8 TaxID=1798371 RepID=A0A1F5YVQ8_9BACT|nr:MAG: 50S ribosomal protein L5 [Candidatus Gottesmanbacteria bacterium RBG_16_37_8]